MTFFPWDGLTSSTGDSSYQLAFRNESGINGSGIPGLRLRKGIDTTWNGWYDILHSGNYSAYSAFSGAITGASLTVTGDVTAFSDARFKENIRPIENVIERIQASRGVVYDRIDNDQKDNVGFIAQELEENFPELVLTREDGTKAVKYQNAVAVLFEAIKKQQTQIEEQDKKLKLILEHLNLNL
ncbi:tail fiber domain-containing protein [Flavobacterium sharifuzzamanii]|nr:tail fiber domain-containing protein [Flavobacterium sharifuzzamanii]